MKRLFPLLLAGLLAAGLAGCTGTAPASAEAGSEPVPTVAAEPTPIPPETQSPA